MPSGRAPSWQGDPPDPLDAPDLYDGVMWRRVVAVLVDWVLLTFVAMAAWILLSVLTALSLGLLAPVKLLAMAFLPVLYAAGTIAAGPAAATPGMRLMGLSVLDWHGWPARFPQAFLMALVFYASVTVTTWLILLVALFNDRRRTLHDFAAGTVVVRAGRRPVRAPA